MWKSPEDNTRKIEQLILTDRLDLGVVEGETMSPDIISRPFMDDELTLICGPRHRFAGMDVIEPKDLANEDFVIREYGSGTRKTFEDVMTAKGLSWRITWTCNNADSIRAAVSEGLGIAVISQRAVVHDITLGLLCALPVRDLEFKRTFKIVYHKNKYLTAPMHHFINLCLNSKL